MKFLIKSFLLCVVILFNIQRAYSAPLCISLGGDCASAMNLRNLGLRLNAYPFDWVVSPFEAVFAALNDDFKYFLHDIKVNSNNTGVNDYYGFNFTHDWPTLYASNIDALNIDVVGASTLYPQWEAAVPSVREKYRRRIERLHDACRGKEKVYFIRSIYVTPEQAITLRDFFRNKYPNLDFLIVAFAQNDTFKQPWNIDGIKNFYLTSWDDAYGFGESLKTIGPEFKDIGISKNLMTLHMLEENICLYENN